MHEVYFSLFAFGSQSPLFLVGLVGVMVKPKALGSLGLPGYSSSLLVNRRRSESTATEKKSLPFDRSLGAPS